MRMKKLIVFDFDGVIADSEMLANTVLAEIATELGTPMTLDAAMRYLSWDLGLTWPFNVGNVRLELIAQVFNLTGSDNFRDPTTGSPLFNFDGTFRGGFGDPQQAQLGAHWVF